MPIVYTLLQRSLQMANQLGKRDMVVVLNPAIYAKALEIRTQTNSNDWSSGWEHFTQFVPLWPQSANNLETLVLQMCWWKVRLLDQGPWQQSFKVITTFVVSICTRYELIKTFRTP